MNDETITRMSLDEAIHRKGKGQTDWETTTAGAGSGPGRRRIRLVAGQGRNAAFEAGHLGAH